MKRSEQIKQWAEDLTIEQMRPILETLVDFTIDAEQISISFAKNIPYWSNTGEPLVEGQEPFEDDETDG